MEHGHIETAGRGKRRRMSEAAAEQSLQPGMLGADGKASSHAAGSALQQVGSKQAASQCRGADGDPQAPLQAGGPATSREAGQRYERSLLTREDRGPVPSGYSPYSPSSTGHTPISPGYTPASVTHAPTSPGGCPAVQGYTPNSYGYSPHTLGRGPISPGYTPGSPAHSPTSLVAASATSSQQPPSHQLQHGQLQPEHQFEQNLQHHPHGQHQQADPGAAGLQAAVKAGCIHAQAPAADAATDQQPAAGSAGPQEPLTGAAALPSSFKDYVVHLTEVYDQRLIESGCKEMEMSRPLGTGAVGVVQLASASLVKHSSPLNNSRVKTENDTRPSSAGKQCDAHSTQSRTLLAAVKVFPAASKDFNLEARALKLLLGKQYVVQLLAVGYVEPADHHRHHQQQQRRLPCLVLQLAWGTLDEYGRCSEAQARKWISQLLQGLSALHAGGLGPDGERIIHRDLKPLNVLIDDKGDILLADFSCCVISKPNSLQAGQIDWGPEHMASFVGSEMYMVPEVGHYTFGGGRYDRSVDSFAVGVITLGLMVGGRRALLKKATPVPADASAQRWSLHQFLGDVMFKYEEPRLQLSAEFRDFLFRCCSLDVRGRYRPEQLLQHVWMTGGSAGHDGGQP